MDFIQYTLLNIISKHLQVKYKAIFFFFLPHHYLNFNLLGFILSFKVHKKIFIKKDEINETL